MSNFMPMHKLINRPICQFILKTISHNKHTLGLGPQLDLIHRPIEIKKTGLGLCISLIGPSPRPISLLRTNPDYLSIYSNQTNRRFHQCTSLLTTKSSIDDSKIYTKTGDKGMTSLFNGERRSKCDPALEALGSVDELSSHLGLAKEYAEERKHAYSDQLERIQCILQDIGSLVATPMPRIPLENAEREKLRKERLSFSCRHILELEEWIDQYTAGLPPLTNFIIPGGGKTSAALHVARTVCRRTERSLIPLIDNGLLDSQVLVYINRLSDYLFTIARIATTLDGLKETIYIRPQTENTANKKDVKHFQGNQELFQL